MTGLDFTTFLETLPSHAIDLAYRIEADRMLNAQFDPEETEAERTVVISERQGAENQPSFLLEEETKAAAFRVHGYRHDTIGDMVDLQTMTRENLIQHYQTYYVPNNAIAVLAGDVQAARSLDRLQVFFGPIPAGPQLPDTRRPEPEQKGERRIVRQGPGQTAYVQISHHVPQASAADFFSLLVMDAALTGPATMAFSGGGGTNRSSRLYKALVESELAASVSGSLVASRDPYVYDLFATVRSDRKSSEVEAALLDELDKLASDSISEQELNKAIKQSKAQFASAAYLFTNQAYCSFISDCTYHLSWFENYIDRLTAVTVDQVQRCAQRYLEPANRTVGWYVPLDAKDDRR
jgi:zinc protease